MKTLGILLLALVVLSGCGPEIFPVASAKDLYADPVHMTGKRVVVRALNVGDGSEGVIDGKPCGWISDTYQQNQGYLDHPSRYNAVAVMPVPAFGNGASVEVEGVYDGEANCIHATRCESVPPR